MPSSRLHKRADFAQVPRCRRVGQAESFLQQRRAWEGLLPLKQGRLMAMSGQPDSW